MLQLPESFLCLKNNFLFNVEFKCSSTQSSTLAFGIDIGQGINVGPGKFGKEINIGP